jgi:two-component system chemotaxis sensor kinase CheA
MSKSNPDIKSRLLTIFRTEAEEHLQAITANLLALERDLPFEQGRSLLEATFRETHTLKGAARSVGLQKVEALCQSLEAVLSSLVHDRLVLTPQILQHLQAGIDGVAHLLAGDEVRVDVAGLSDRLTDVAAGAAATMAPVDRVARLQDRASAGPSSDPAVPPPPEPAPGLPPRETVRLATARLDALLLQAEDLLIPRLAWEQRTLEIKALVKGLVQYRTQLKATRSSAALEDPFRELESRGRELLAQALRDQRGTAAIVDALLDAVRELRMMPAASILGPFPRMVHDLAAEFGKEIDWSVRGADLEVDRKILETVKEPLIHLVRNAVDHGIEPPEVRRQADKSARGRITLSVALLEDGQVEFCVEDDGRGIHVEEVRQAAVRARLVAGDAAMNLTDEDAMSLLFRSGLTTSPIITDVSGHGLGLAIVKERTESQGGQVRLVTSPGLGTAVHLRVPARVAAFHGLLVRAADHLFLLPLDTVERVIRMTPDQIEHAEGREMIRWDGSALSVGRLADTLGLPVPAKHPSENGATKLPGVVIRSGPERAAFLVDEILGTREVLLKEFTPPVIRLRNVAGAGLLGTGQVVLILRPADLLTALQEGPPTPVPQAHAEAARPQRAILVVDDSVTTRTMERNLLEAAGFKVRVAVDGIEAWTALRTEECDLVVSDVDMPRMDGFDLTARIRADRKFADLPVILVTALESRADKERGVEVGANAYIVKSSFEQSNLLEIIRRLI